MCGIERAKGWEWKCRVRENPKSDTVFSQFPLKNMSDVAQKTDIQTKNLEKPESRTQRFTNYGVVLISIKFSQLVCCYLTHL